MRRCFASFLALVVLLGAIGPAAADVVVMSRNLYVGADVGPPTQAVLTGDPNLIIPAVTQFYARVQASNLPERSMAFAAEIARTQPTLIGLQEASLFRTGPFGGGPPTTVASDSLQLLLGALSARGLSYAPVVITTNSDVTLPYLSTTGLANLRLTDREVILARTDLPSHHFSLSNPQGGNFTARLSLPIGTTGGTLELVRGWASIDASYGGQEFRFLSTHLEEFDPLQTLQALELLAGVAGGPLPTVVVGDLNSPADGSGGQALNAFLAAGYHDAWAQLHPGDPGYTWGPDDNLLNPLHAATQRIDYLLTHGALFPREVSLIGVAPEERTPSGLWPSDHAGVVGTLAVSVPEPATIALLAIGYFLVNRHHRRRRARSASRACYLLVVLILGALAHDSANAETPPPVSNPPRLVWERPPDASPDRDVFAEVTKAPPIDPCLLHKEFAVHLQAGFPAGVRIQVPLFDRTNRYTVAETFVGTEWDLVGVATLGLRTIFEIGKDSSTIFVVGPGLHGLYYQTLDDDRESGWGVTVDTTLGWVIDPDKTGALEFGFNLGLSVISAERRVFPVPSFGIYGGVHF